MCGDDSKGPHPRRARAPLVELTVEHELAHQHRRRRDLQQSRAERSSVQLPPVEGPSAGGFLELAEAVAAQLRDVDRRVMSRCSGFQFALPYHR